MATQTPKDFSSCEFELGLENLSPSFWKHFSDVYVPQCRRGRPFDSPGGQFNLQFMDSISTFKSMKPSQAATIHRWEQTFGAVFTEYIHHQIEQEWIETYEAEVAKLHPSLVGFHLVGFINGLGLKTFYIDTDHLVRDMIGFEHKSALTPLDDSLPAELYSFLRSHDCFADMIGSWATVSIRLSAELYGQNLLKARGKVQWNCPKIEFGSFTDIVHRGVLFQMIPKVKEPMLSRDYPSGADLPDFKLEGPYDWQWGSDLQGFSCCVPWSTIEQADDKTYTEHILTVTTIRHFQGRYTHQRECRYSLRIPTEQLQPIPPAEPWSQISVLHTLLQDQPAHSNGRYQTLPKLRGAGGRVGSPVPKRKSHRLSFHSPEYSESSQRLWVPSLQSRWHYRKSSDSSRPDFGADREVDDWLESDERRRVCRNLNDKNNEGSDTAMRHWSFGSPTNDKSVLAHSGIYGWTRHLDVEPPHRGKEASQDLEAFDDDFSIHSPQVSQKEVACEVLRPSNASSEEWKQRTNSTTTGASRTPSEGPQPLTKASSITESEGSQLWSAMHLPTSDEASIGCGSPKPNALTDDVMFEENEAGPSCSGALYPPRLHGDLRLEALNALRSLESMPGRSRTLRGRAKGRAIGRADYAEWSNRRKRQNNFWPNFDSEEILQRLLARRRAKQADGADLEAGKTDQANTKASKTDLAGDIAEEEEESNGSSGKPGLSEEDQLAQNTMGRKELHAKILEAWAQDQEATFTQDDIDEFEEHFWGGSTDEPGTDLSTHGSIGQDHSEDTEVTIVEDMKHVRGSVLEEESNADSDNLPSLLATDDNEETMDQYTNFVYRHSLRPIANDEASSKAGSDDLSAALRSEMGSYTEEMIPYARFLYRYNLGPIPDDSSSFCDLDDYPPLSGSGRRFYRDNMTRYSRFRARCDIEMMQHEADSSSSDWEHCSCGASSLYADSKDFAGGDKMAGNGLRNGSEMVEYALLLEG